MMDRVVWGLSIDYWTKERGFEGDDQGGEDWTSEVKVGSKPFNLVEEDARKMRELEPCDIEKLVSMSGIVIRYGEVMYCGGPGHAQCRFPLSINRLTPQLLRTDPGHAQCRVRVQRGRVRGEGECVDRQGPRVRAVALRRVRAGGELRTETQLLRVRHQTVREAAGNAGIYPGRRDAAVHPAVSLRPDVRLHAPRGQGRGDGHLARSQPADGVEPQVGECVVLQYGVCGRTRGIMVGL